jgi:hypothetical protein
MAVIKCSLKDGRLHVEEVMEFQKGDTIMLEKSAHSETPLNTEIFQTIPCPSIQGDVEGRSDCWTLKRPIPPRDKVVKK